MSPEGPNVITGSRRARVGAGWGGGEGVLAREFSGTPGASEHQGPVESLGVTGCPCLLERTGPKGLSGLR